MRHALLAALVAGATSLAFYSPSELFSSGINHAAGLRRETRPDDPQLAAPLAAIMVNSLQDTVSGSDGKCTLREAIAAANTDTASGGTTGECAAGNSADTITFSVLGTITLTGTELTIASDLTITNPSAPTLIVSGNNTSRVLRIDSGTVTISGLTIAHGKPSSGAGGAISNAGNLTINGCTISNSSSAGNGGGIQSNSVLTISNSTIQDNSSSVQGGGLRLLGTATISNSTISGNSGSSGGGISSTATLTISNTTISNNSVATSGGGISRTSGTATLNNSIIAGNLRGTATRDDLNGAFNSISAFNLVGDGTGMTGLTNATNENQVGSSGSPINPLLGPLQYNGGHTQTHALLTGSPAIDKGGSTLNPDQRGLTRPFEDPEIGDADGNGADIGSVELQQRENLLVNSLADTDDGVCDAASCTLREAITTANLATTQNAIYFSVTGAIARTGEQLTIDGDVTINGPGARLLTVRGSSLSRVFQINAGKRASIYGLTISGGVVPPFSGGGGGIRNLGLLTIGKCFISDNQAADGGGIANTDFLSITDSTLSGNVAAGVGGGIWNANYLFISNTTITGNLADIGGGIYNRSSVLTLTNTTITKNHADSDNSGNGFGGGISHEPISLSNLTLHNSIVADNFVGSGTSTRGDIGGGGAVDTRSSFNLIGVNAGFSGPTHGSNGNQIGTSASPLDPLLSPLQFNGGSTPTQTLLPNSPAIDKGNSAFSEDQRGLPRLVDIAAITNATGGNGSDIGAVEVTASQNLLVNSFADTNDNVCDASQCTLREAVNAANANADFNLITFTFPVSVAITLTGSQLVLASNLAINGPSPNVLGISGNDASRVFLVDDNQTVSLSNLTVTNGNAGTGSGGGILLDPNSHLTVNNCTISNNKTGASSSGGGIRNNSATLVIHNSTISGNSAGVGGGIVSNSATQALTSINHSTISGNSANAGSGGGIFSNRTLLINNSTINGNSATGGTGGGVWSSGTLTVNTSTISGNTATGDGGGFSNSGNATLNDTTITNNHSHNVPNDGQCCLGGGVTNTFGQVVTLYNCIIAGNFTGPDIFRPSDVVGSFDTNSSFNLIGNGEASGGSLINGTNRNQIGTTQSPINPLLGPLANNGGPTNTHALLPGSPALDKGRSLLLTDQRGLRRQVDLSFITNASAGDASDIGAFELQSLEVLTVNSLADTDDGACDISNCTLREAVDAADANSDFNLIRFTVTGTITLTGGQFVLNTPLAIDGPGVSLLTINGNNNSRGFLVNGSSVVAFSGLTITNGNGGTGFGSISSGGAIRLNPGTHATVNNCTISGNRVSLSNAGGGIHNERGTLVINQSTLSGNSATRGGGVSIASSSPLTVINNSTISGNSATRGGGGIHNQGLLEINYSTINGNSESFEGGGGIFNVSPGNLTATNCSVSGNSTVSEGGGINSAGTLTLTRTTITNNHADTDNNGIGGGGGLTFSSASAGTLHNTIVAGNFKGSGTNTPDDVFGVLNANSSFNLIGNGTNMMGLTNGMNNNQVGTAANPINARLAPLFTNGGPTQTHALLPGSPALDAGSNDLSMPLTDQRGLGFPRNADGPDADSSSKSDIGAFEAYPSIEDFPDKSTNKNVPLSFNFNVGDASAGITSVVPVSSNTTLVPNANLVITGTTGTRTLQITPAANQVGQTTINVTVTAPNGQTMSDSFVLTVNDVPNNVQFSAAGYSIGEGAFNATINITRSGDTSGTATVDFATSDNTASQRTDYAIGAGTLSFAPGETSKTFEVLIVDDLYVEGAETLNLSLSDPTGNVVVGSPSVAVLTIVDNDSGSPTTNPLDNADQRFFVRQHFYDFLSRSPDPGGFDFWVGQITQCGTNQTCINNKRLDVSNAFFFELEFQQTGAYVYRLYRAAFGNTQPFPNPDNSNATEANKLPGYTVFARDRARVVGGANLAQGQQNLANVFVQRLEFLAKYPIHLDGPAFIDAVVNTIMSDLGVNLTAQKPGLLTLYNSGGRGAVMYRLADDAAQTNPINNRALIDAEYNRAFVATQYFGYLRRDSDIGGFLFWLGQVNSAPLRSLTRQRAMVCAFITSAEYQQRFSPVTTHTNAECQ